MQILANVCVCLVSRVCQECEVCEMCEMFKIRMINFAMRDECMVCGVCVCDDKND